VLPDLGVVGKQYVSDCSTSIAKISSYLIFASEIGFAFLFPRIGLFSFLGFGRNSIDSFPTVVQNSL
jgi:hypothetical protein